MVIEISDAGIRVGDMLLSLCAEPPVSAITLRESYAPFLAGGQADVHLTVRTMVHARQDQGSPVFRSAKWVFWRDGSKVTVETYAGSSGPCRILRLDRASYQGQLVCNEDSPYNSVEPALGYPLDEILIIDLLSRGRGALLHACAVDADGRGLAFVGKSGAGKSTTARLWLQRDDATVLCDDRIVVRKMDGVFRAYGTPWHGDIPAVSPASAPLEKLLFIRHGAENRLTPLRPAEAVSRLMGCVFTTWWDPQGLAFTLSFLEELARTVPCYEFAFRPEPEALDAVLAL